MIVINFLKEVLLFKIYFKYWKLIRINYIEIICYIYFCVFFLCEFYGELLILIVMGVLCGFDDL